MLREQEAEFLQLIENELVSNNCELFALRIYHSSRGQRITCLIDHAEGGITLEECARWNRRIGDLIDRQEWVQGPYLIEVASPGLDWPLTSEKDYRRLTGRRLKLAYRTPTGEVETTAELMSAANGRLYVKPAKGECLDICVADVVRARAEIGF